MKEVKKLVVGALQTNCYLLIEDNHCIIVDPGANHKRILENVNEKYGLRSKARGILCAVPVEKAYKI